MHPSDPFEDQDRDSREYRAQVLEAPALTREGILHRSGDGEVLLPWSRIRFGTAAMVGEPEGVCAVVFELLLEASETHIRVGRMHADPADDAIPLSVGIADGLGPERSSAPLREMAAKGSTDWWFPDLESFEAAARRQLTAHAAKAPAGA